MKPFHPSISLNKDPAERSVSLKHLSLHLKRTSGWAHQWKMMFNPHITKQTQEVIFSRKIVKPFHPSVSLNEVPVEHSASLKHLSLHIDQKLNFKKVYTDEKTSKEQKGI